MASFNYLKEWHGTVGGLKVTQTAQPIGDGEKLHVITGWRAGADFLAPYFNDGSEILFADAEMLRDDDFRMALARQHITARAKELRAAADFAEKALAEPAMQNAAEVRAELKQQIRDCACMDSDGCEKCRAAQAAIDALGPVVAAEAQP